jgi:predicted ATPase
MAEDRPLVLVLEDLHWADPTTLELVTQLAHAAQDSEPESDGRRPSLLLLFTARPEFTPPWPIDRVALLPVPRLEADQARALAVSAFGGGRPIASDLLDEIVRRSDGVPLFVEEIAHALAEQTSAADEQGAPSGAAMATFPPGLHDLLRARLDRLSTPARETIQLAAVLGREFRYELLRSAAQADDTSLRADLRELQASGLVLPRRGALSETFMFKHALVRDAAYESLTRSARTRLHRAVAEILRTRFPDLGERHPELLGLHL